MIRKYADHDIDTLLDVWFEASSLAHPFLTSDFMAKERNNIREIYIPNTETWIYEKDGRVEGFISMIKNEVGAIFVNPKLHGMGIGRQLMDHVRSLYDSLEVEVFEQNSIGRRFYDAYGFQQIKTYVHSETGQTVIRMKL